MTDVIFGLREWETHSSKRHMNRIATLASPTTSIIGTCPIFLTIRQFGDESNDGVVSISETSATWIGEKITVPTFHSLLPGNRLVAAHILNRINQRLKPTVD